MELELRIELLKRAYMVLEITGFKCGEKLVFKASYPFEKVYDEIEYWFSKDWVENVRVLDELYDPKTRKYFQSNWEEEE